MRDLAEFEEAEQLHRKSLDILESSDPTLRPAMFATKSDLADLFWSLGKYEEAETLARQAVCGQSDLLGTSHVDTITSMGVLSLVLCALADREEVTGDLEADKLSHSRGTRYGEAAGLAREVFESRKEILGLNHPQSLMSMKNLSWILRNKGNFVESELLNREALARKEKELGKDHHDTLNCKYCLAVVLGCQGRYEEAEQVHREHLEAVVKVLGKEHPNTMRSMRGLGKVLEAQGKVEQALEIYRKAYKGLLNSFGSDRVITLESKALLESLSDCIVRENRYSYIPVNSEI